MSKKNNFNKFICSYHNCKEIEMNTPFINHAFRVFKFYDKIFIIHRNVETVAVNLWPFPMVKNITHYNIIELDADIVSRFDFENNCSYAVSIIDCCIDYALGDNQMKDYKELFESDKYTKNEMLYVKFEVDDKTEKLSECTFWKLKGDLVEILEAW